MGQDDHSAAIGMSRELLGLDARKKAEFDKRCHLLEYPFSSLN